MNNQLNKTLQNIYNAKKQGKNPQVVMNMMLQQNPQMQQTLTQLKNMANGRSPRDFFTDLARQHGANDQSIEYLNGLFD